MKIQNLFFLLLLVFLSHISIAQKVRGKGDIVKQQRNVGAFHSISIDGAQDAVLMQGPEYRVMVETNENLLDYIRVAIQDSILSFEYDEIGYYDRMKFYITSPSYSSIQVAGASDVVSRDTLDGEDLNIMASSASDVRLWVRYGHLTTIAKGSSEIQLKGYASRHLITASGASEIIARELMTDTTVIRASGASNCFVEATKSLTYKATGASSIKYVGKPESVIIQDRKGEENVVILRDTDEGASVYHFSDTTDVNLGLFDVEVIEGDTTKVSVGKHQIVVDEEGNVKYRKKYKKFNGHWGGVELGINGYVTPEFNTNFGKEYDYLSLRYEKSIAVNLNIYEQNIPLNKDRNMGLVTGIGLAWNNYRFGQQTYLTPDSSEVYGFYMEDVSVRKTKLTAMYITVPLFFEIQTKNNRRWKMFHFGIGGLVSARVRTHTKIFFNEAAKEYRLYDPRTESFAPGVFVTPDASQRNIVKEYNSFYLPPFKFDAMVRIGYSVINVFFTYSLNTMFQQDRGPELYRWTAGIMLVGW